MSVGVVIRFESSRWGRELVVDAGSLGLLVLFVTLTYGFDGIAPFILSVMATAFLIGITYRTLTRTDER